MVYSKKPFEGYTHRYKVAFEVYEQDHTSNIDLYTDESDRDRVHEYLVEKVNRRNVLSFAIVHVATKEEDEMATEFLKDL